MALKHDALHTLHGEGAPDPGGDPVRLPGVSAEGAREEGFSPTEEVATWDDWRDYLRLVRWLIPDVYRHARLQSVALALLSALGVGGRAATIGTLLLYVHAKNEGRDVTLFGAQLPSGNDPATYLAWGGAVLCFAAVAIACAYAADLIIYNLARTYAEDATRRVMGFVAAGGRVRLPDDLDESGVRPVLRMLVGDTFALVRVVTQSLGVLLPSITLLVCVGVLVASNAVLTAILVPLVAAYAFLLGRLNRQVLRDSQQRRLTKRIHGRDVGKMLKTLQVTRFPAGQEPHWLSGYPERSWMGLAFDAFRGIVLAKRRVDYLGEGFQAVALLAILMVFGTYIASQGTSWAALLTYLAALGYGVRSLGRASKCVTAANRFLPNVRRYVSFVRTHPEPETLRDRSREGFGSELPIFRAAEPALPESEPSRAARPGEPILCIYPERLRGPRLGEFCFALAGGDAADAVRLESELFFLRRTVPLPERELWDLLRGDRDREAEWVRAEALLRELEVWDELCEKLGGPHVVLTTPLDRTLSEPLRLALRLLPGLLSEARLFVLGYENVEGFGETQRNALFRGLSDRLVLLVPFRPPERLPVGLERAMIVGAKAVQGIGDADWYARIGHHHVEDLGEDADEADLDESLDYDDEELVD